jgi:hypothetical protein
MWGQPSGLSTRAKHSKTRTHPSKLSPRKLRKKRNGLGIFALRPFSFRGTLSGGLTAAGEDCSAGWEC